MAKIKKDTHLVLKCEDTNEYLTQAERRVLVSLIIKIEKGRISENKKLNSYYVCNLDEPYADKVFQTILSGEDEKEKDKIHYTDKNGNIVKIGDRLKFEKPMIENRTEFDCAEPTFRLELFDGKPMLYVSGMDEYHEVSEWQAEDDEPNTLKHFEKLED